jgi:hypothetical protein
MAKEMGKPSNRDWIWKKKKNVKSVVASATVIKTSITHN